MAQLTLRVDDELADELRRVAAQRGESMNALAITVLRAAVDPEAAGSAVERFRERLARAGLLAEPPSESVTRPDPEDVTAAARKAAQGKMLSDMVLEDRG